MRRQPLALLAGTGLLLAGGAAFAALRLAGPLDGCPRKQDLVPPKIDFVQAPRKYVTVTITNPNDCYGFRDEPVEMRLLRAHGQRAIAYTGEGPPHSDVGVCCNLTLPPRGRWTMTFGSEVNRLGADRVRICNITIDLLSNKGHDAWVRMPEGGSILGRTSWPPDFTPLSPSPEPIRPDDLAEC